MIIQSASTHGKVKYSATRFGNVLRDACDTGDNLIAKEALRSVVPTFKRPEDVNKEIA